MMPVTPTATRSVPLLNEQIQRQTYQPSDEESSAFTQSIIEIRNSESFSSEKNELALRSKDRITRFLRKAIAVQSYGSMFSRGINFKKLGYDLPVADGKYDFSVMDHLEKLSQHYLKSIKEKVSNLTQNERHLLSQVINTRVLFRHQSNSYLAEEGTLNIFSNQKLAKTGIASGQNTYSFDTKYLSNHDFVFFGLEFSYNKYLSPLNKTHNGADFGANVYLLEEKFPYGYLTLTDHFDNKVLQGYFQEHRKFNSQFPRACYEVGRFIHGEKGQEDVPIFSVKDMKLALGLYLIDFIRHSTDPEFKQFALSGKLDGFDFDHLMNFIFSPEFHVPRMVSTTDYKEIQSRMITITEAVRASNFQRLSFAITNKATACKAMGEAIVSNKKDVVNYLFERWDFQQADIIDMRISYNPFMKFIFMDVNYLLSNNDTDVDILKLFLEKELIDVNKSFESFYEGMTMMDNALSTNNVAVTKMLKAHGALTSDELKLNQHQTQGQ